MEGYAGGGVIQCRKAGTTIFYIDGPNDVGYIDSNFGVNNSGVFGTSAAGVLAIGNGTIPSTSPANMVQLYAEDVAASSELKVRDEAGNITTLSPHNFSNIPDGPSEEMAFSYYSERHGKSINVDILKVVRLVEQLTDEQLVYLEAA